MEFSRRVLNSVRRSRGSMVLAQLSLLGLTASFVPLPRVVWMEYEVAVTSTVMHLADRSPWSPEILEEKEVLRTQSTK